MRTRSEMLVEEKLPLQKVLKSIGETGCYFLTLRNSARLLERTSKLERDGSVIEDYFSNLEKGFIKADCSVNDPSKVIGESLSVRGGSYVVFPENSCFDGRTIEEIKKRCSLIVPSGKYLVFGQFEWKFTHFVGLDNKFKVFYDSLGMSYSVRNGELKALRLTRIKDDVDLLDVVKDNYILYI